MLKVTEKTVLVPISEMAQKIPGRGNRGIHLSTIVRWIHFGMKGVRLQAIRTGGKWQTTWAALREFFEAVTAASQNGPTDPPKSSDDEAVKNLLRKGKL